MADQPKTSFAAQVVYERLQEQIAQLGGLTDNHVKKMTYIVKHHLKFDKFRFEIKYLESPKQFIVHCYLADGREVFVRPKEPLTLDKINKYMNLDQWRFEFAQRVIE